MRKIRVVSTIILLCMFIGLLPAEQAFADPSSGVWDMANYLGVYGADWAMHIVTGDDGKISVFDDNNNSLDSPTSIKIKLKASEDNPSDILSSVFFNASGDGLEKWNLADGSGVRGYKFSNKIKIDGIEYLGLNSSIIKGDLWGLLQSYNVPTSEIGGPTSYSLSEIDEGFNIYTYEMFVSDQNDPDQIFDSDDDDWVYQRVICNYNSTLDAFVYTSMCYNQNHGSADDIWITSRASRNFFLFGLFPYNKDNSGHEYYSAAKNFLEARLKSEEVTNLIKDSSASLYKTYVNMHDGTVDDSYPYNIQVSKPSDSDAPILSWVGSTTTESWPLLDSLVYAAPYTDKLSDNYPAASKYLYCALLNAYYIKKNDSNDDSLRYSVCVKAETAVMTLNHLGSGLARVFHEAGNSASSTVVAECTKMSNESSSSDSDKLNAEIDNVKIEYQQITWGEAIEKNLSEPTTVWDSYVTLFVSYYNAFSTEGTLGGPVKKPVTNKVNGTEAVEGMKTVVNDVKGRIAMDNYNSDTGALVADILKELVNAGAVSINYDTSSDAYFDWRTLSENVSGGITVSSYRDLLYVLAYLEYFRTLDENSELIQSAVVSHNGTTLNLLFNTEANKSVITSTALNVWYTETGEITTKPDEAEAYYGSVKDAFKSKKFYNRILGQAPGVYSEVTKAARAVATSYYSLTGEYLLGETSMWSSGASFDTPVNADQLLEVRETIGKISDGFMVTKTAMNSLSYSYANFLYARIGSTSGLGEGSIEGIDYYMAFDTFMTEPYNRADSLKYSAYADMDGADIDYLPRLPVLSKALSKYEYTLLYNVDYGLSVLDWSTYAEQNETSPEQIEDWINSDVAQSTILEIVNFIGTNGGYPTALEWARSGVYDNISDEYLHLFKTIINVKKLCDLLASLENDANKDKSGYTSVTGKDIADKWSPAVSKFYALYSINPNVEEFFDAVGTNLFRYTVNEFSYSDAVEPLGFVIKFESEELSSQWKYGYGLSALHVPFRTNLYEISSIEKMAEDSEWVTEFYYKYGFYRKALFVTTDPEATVKRYLSGAHSSTKVATLRDLLNYDRDIELYIDQGFYNASELEQQLDRFISNSGGDSIFGSIFDACVLTPEAILKDTGYTNYASDIQKGVCPLGVEIVTEEDKAKFEYDNFILTEEEIVGAKGMLSAYEYSIQQPYGVISAVYRTRAVYDMVNRAATENPPVFVSSKNVAGLSGTDSDCYRAFYNYIILSAMQEVLESETTLLVDLDAPIFVDIFGNIVTSNGYVIIPAAANATLSGESFNPYSLGFATYINAADPEIYKGLTDKCYDFLYGIDYAYAMGRKSTSSYASTFRERQQSIGGGYLFLRQDGTTTLGTTSLSDGTAAVTVTWDRPNTHTAALKNLLLSVHFINAANTYDTRHVNLIVETLRGAPIEHIDLNEEGLSTTHALTKGGAYFSYKLEQLMNAIHTDSNGTEKSVKFSATLSVLDLFHIESAEKVALLVVKFALIGFLFLLAAQIVADSTVGRMPIRTVGRVVVTCALMGTCISLLPVLTEFSLSTMTKMMLQPEASELLAMQSQREAYGIEIGTTESYNTKSSTSIIARVGELDVNWYDQLLYSVYSDINNSFQDLYDENAKNVPIAQASYTFTSGKDIYMDLTKVMDTTVLQYNAELGLLTNQRAAGVTDADCSASYILPYYIFLDQLVANVNMYNKQNGVQPLSYSVNSDGSIRTKDMTYAYFHSREFLEDDYDILDLRRIFNVSSPKLGYCPIYTTEDMVPMSYSLWFPSEENLSIWSEAETSESNLEESISQLYGKARQYAINNSYMLSYVSDAAYLKSFAMYLAIEYNNIFGVGVADSFELKCVDTKDLLRYVVSTPQNVYKFANRTYARYAYETEGVAGVILAGLLYFAFALTNAIKVVSYVLTYIISAGSIVYHRLFKKEEDYTLYGFLMLIGEITLLNLVYAVTFKVIMNLTRWGVPPLLAMGIGILIQILIAVAFGLIVVNGTKNVRNLGKREVDAIHHFMNRFSRDRVPASGTPANAANTEEQTVDTLQAHDFSRVSNDNFTGEYSDVEDLMEHDRRREEGEIESETEEEET